MNPKVKLNLSDDAKKELKSIKDKNIQKKIARKIDMLQQNPDIGERLKHDLKFLYKVRADNYRIIYDKQTVPGTNIIEINITIIMFEDRKLVYKPKTKKIILKRYEELTNTKNI